MDDLSIYLNQDKGQDFIDTVKTKRFSFALVISYTATCEIPGISIAGPSPDQMKFTPAADAELLHYGYCQCIDHIPMTPDGKPTPAILTKAALESASIPHFVINAGSSVTPNVPFIEANLPPGNDISKKPALDEETVIHAINFGRIIGRTLASVTDCLIIGESLPGGTTTALATLRALGYDAKVSSSSPVNPVDLKNEVVRQALSRNMNNKPISIVSHTGDPMIPFVAGMVSTATRVSKVLLAGGTQMAAVLALAKTLGYDNNSLAIGSTSYVINDESSNFLEIIKQVDTVPVLGVDPKLSLSKISGLKAFSEGFAKEGVGAGGTIISAILKANQNSIELLKKFELEYQNLFND